MLIRSALLTCDKYVYLAYIRVSIQTGNTCDMEMKMEFANPFEYTKQYVMLACWIVPGVSTIEPIYAEQSMHSYYVRV